MATYNGQDFVERQLKSILNQLQRHDEVIIVDDLSRDQTIDRINQLNDPRIRLLTNEKNLGPAKTFERALIEARHDVMFLADQDDVWHPEKIPTIRKLFDDPRLQLSIHDCQIVDAELREIYPSFFSFRNVRNGIIRNFVINGYVGCCMTLRKSLLMRTLPFPSSRDVLHDAWIGLIAQIHGVEPLLIPEKYLQFVRHGKNASSTSRNRPIPKRLWERKELILSLAKHYLPRGRRNAA
jgi:cellulose synthase/poly-beta-1,6-N-acetylglucosamine synthase-like glycosyltransferase